MTEMIIRRPEACEHSAVRAVVQAVVDEVYGNLWAPPPLPIDEEDWRLSWVAILHTKIVGMVLTHDEWISDLWVLREARGRGIGQKLLARGEAEIRSRGCRKLRLRVVKANPAASGFYQRQGWRVEREFPHENLPITMLEMTKLSQHGTSVADPE